MRLRSGRTNLTTARSALRALARQAHPGGTSVAPQAGLPSLAPAKPSHGPETVCGFGEGFHLRKPRSDSAPVSTRSENSPTPDKGLASASYPPSSDAPLKTTRQGPVEVAAALPCPRCINISRAVRASRSQIAAGLLLELVVGGLTFG